MEDISQSLITAITRVFDMLYLEYVFSSILLTWLMVKYILPNNIMEWKLKLFSAGIATAMGALYYFIGEYKLTYLVYSGLTLVTFYEWFAKFIFKAFGVDYKAGDPELIKKKNENQ